tara:strand:+ start:729 stop:1076 length:348 start_codon:yes stop_codon:yes gene_type:complete
MKMIEVIVFVLCSAALAGGAFALMWKNISDINHSSTTNKRPMDKNPENPLNSNHPEVKEIKGTDELLVVNFEKDTRDPLNKSLQDRIDALNDEIDDPWDDEDDDDGGGDVVVVRR